jgi:CelD/BcsL family acetyltransferase involved in cellulose biosynthesis
MPDSMSLTVEVVSRRDQLGRADLELWNELAVNPLQRWEWLGSWAEAFETQCPLQVLRVRRDRQTVAFVPWCSEYRLSSGRTLQFLGAGKASTDHLSLLVRPDDVQEVCRAVAGCLTGEQPVHACSDPTGGRLRWDTVELVGVDRDDAVVNHLVSVLRERGLPLEVEGDVGCYAIDLPDRWEDYVAMRSKSGRREIRQSLKQIEQRSLVVETLQRREQLDEFWPQFVTLHQRRRQASGTTGCFDHPGFETFLYRAACRLFESGLLKILVARAGDVPVGAHFALVDDRCWYFYQSGMEPDAQALRPGLGLFCQAIRESIQMGHRRFDMMRGDEAYKKRWRAELMATQRVRVLNPKGTARIRNQARKVGASLKHLVKTGLGAGQPQTV